MSASVTAQGAAQHEAAATTEARPLAWYGMVFFIASEAVFFANLIAAYLYLRVRAGAWPAPSDAAFTFELNKVLVGINTVILLSSSFPMHRAGRAAARGDRGALVRNLIFTAILGAAFLSIQAYEFTHSSFGPTSGIFGSTFYTLTGFHGAHVTAGLIFILVTTVRAARGHFSAKHHLAVQAAEMYWHFVDVVWIFLFTLVYLLTK
ncbi:MAG TPA: cytochrome c oxidase subunit 3 [Ktedonobacterales bacterium]|jgi:heme/copper-type cytochrome/quinol oxidase subunit 3